MKTGYAVCYGDKMLINTIRSTQLEAQNVVVTASGAKDWAEAMSIYGYDVKPVQCVDRKWSIIEQ